MSDWNHHVLPHGPLTSLAPRLWQVTGSLKNQPLPRNMCIYRLESGGLWIHSAICLDDEGMAAVETLGLVEVVVVPSGMHRLDGGVWKERYPEARLCCPEIARAKVEELYAVDDTCESALPPLGITVHHPPGARGIECTYELDLGAGRALVFCDAIFHIRERLPGFKGWVVKLMGSSGFFGTSRLGRLLMKEHQAWGEWLLEQSSRSDLVALTVAHGDAVTEAIPAKLVEAAARVGVTPS